MRNYAELMRRFRERGLDRGEPERGSLSRFGKHAGVSPRYLSHVNNGRKHLGDESCRKIEAAFGLPPGWMDHDHVVGAVPDSQPEREFLELALRLFRESPVDAQAALLRYMADRLLSAIGIGGDRGGLAL